MRVNLVKCDRCYKENAKSYGINVDRRVDGAGSMEDVSLTADLCNECAAAYFNYLILDLPVDKVSEALTRFRSNSGKPVFTRD